MSAYLIGLRIVLTPIVSFFITRLLGLFYIRWAKGKQLGEKIRKDGPQTHIEKSGTPTMGGLFLFAGLLLSSLLLVELSNRKVFALLSAMLLFGSVGFIDDVTKRFIKGSDGLKITKKLLLQIAASALALVILQGAAAEGTTLLYLPWNRAAAADLGFWYYPLAVVFILYMVNGVNFTDGLDGLAGGIVFLVLGFLAATAYFFAPLFSSEEKLQVTLVLLLSAGAVAGFLWYNLAPAKVFMGDVGSLGLGGLIGSAALLLHAEIALLIAGFVFFAEIISVVLQVTSFKLRHKRIFRMAPLHHHFEMKGIPETLVVRRFWIIGAVSVAAALAVSTMRFII